MRLLPVILLMLLAVPASASTYDFPVTRVVDGDTVNFEAKFLPAPLKPEMSVRVYGVDTPEKAPRAKCQAEADKAKSTSAFTRAALKSAKDVKVEIRAWDKYGDRVLGDVIYDGKRLSEELIKSGLAVQYFGGKKQSWCN